MTTYSEAYKEAREWCRGRTVGEPSEEFISDIASLMLDQRKLDTKTVENLRENLSEETRRANSIAGNLQRIRQRIHIALGNAGWVVDVEGEREGMAHSGGADGALEALLTVALGQRLQQDRLQKAINHINSAIAGGIGGGGAASSAAGKHFTDGLTILEGLQS